MSKHKQELVQRARMSLLNRRDPDFVPNIYFNYIPAPSAPKLTVLAISMPILQISSALALMVLVLLVQI